MLKGKVKQKLYRKSDKRSKIFNIERIDNNNFTRVFNFIKYCIKWLCDNDAHSQEGIFRKSPDEKRFQEVKKEIEKQNGELNINKNEEHHVVTALIKRFLGSIGEPIFTFDLYSTFIAANANDSEEQKKTDIQVALSLLPENNYKILFVLFKYLNELSTHHKVTKMDAKNLAIVFAPNVLKPPGNEASTILLIADIGHLIELVHTMIVFVDNLFEKQSLKDSGSVAFKRAMQTRYSYHTLASLKALEDLRQEELTLSNKLSWVDKLSYIKFRLQDGDTEIAGAFLEENNNNILKNPRKIKKHVRNVENRRARLSSIFKNVPTQHTTSNVIELKNDTLLQVDDNDPNGKKNNTTPVDEYNNIQIIDDNEQRNDSVPVDGVSVDQNNDEVKIVIEKVLGNNIDKEKEIVDILRRQISNLHISPIMVNPDNTEIT